MGKRKPALRFKGFEGEWDKCKLKDIALFNPKADIPEQFEYVDLESVVGTEMVSHRTETRNTAPSRAQRLANIGDLFYQTVRPYQKNNCLFEKRDGCYVFSTGYAQMRPYTDSYFLLSLLQNNLFLKSVLNQCTGTSYPAINSIVLAEIEVSFSIYNENRKIGVFFKHLDTIIIQQQRKYDSLLNVKKSMLEKMFPKDGADVPEIRFKGFSGAWEQRKFTDITFPAGEKNKVNLPLESYSISNDRGFIPQNELFENGGTMRDADKSMYYIVSQNSFAYNPARINVGSIGYYDLPENVIVSSLYEVFKTTEDIDDRFLWYWFKSETFQRMIEQYQEGGVRLYFYYDKLCMCSITLPSFKEQNLIGVTFDKLDTLLTQHQKKLDHLKHIKSALLEKMFVSEAA